MFDQEGVVCELNFLFSREEEEKQSDDQDYKHLQMISRSSSYNPPPCLGVSGSVAVAGGGDDKGDHKGETLATGGWGSLENSLDCAHGGRGRSYRLEIRSTDSFTCPCQFSSEHDFL